MPNVYDDDRESLWFADESEWMDHDEVIADIAWQACEVGAARLMAMPLERLHQLPGCQCSDHNPGQARP